MIQPTADIDWDQVRQRISAGEAGLRRALNPEPEDVRAAYRARARQLAEQPADASVSDPASPYLLFCLADQRYAVDLSRVAEIARLGECTPLPGGPAELAGVFNHRGEVRSLLDLALMLGHAQTRTSVAEFCLVLQSAGRHLRVRIDRPEGIRRLDHNILAPPPPATGSGPDSSFVQGVHPDGTMVLSVESLFSHPSAPRAPEGPDPHQDESPTDKAGASFPTA